MKRPLASLSLAFSFMALLWAPTQAQDIRRLTGEACACIDSKVKQYHRIIVQYMYDYVDLGEETAGRNLKSRYAGLSAEAQQQVQEDINALDAEIGSIVGNCLSTIKGMNLSDAQMDVLKQELSDNKQCYPLLYYIATNSNDSKTEEKEKDTPSAIDPNQEASALAEDICDCAYRKIDRLHPIVQEFLIELIDLEDSDHIVSNYNRRYDKLNEQEKEKASQDLAYVQSPAFKDYIYECLSVVSSLDEAAYDALLNAVKEEPYCKKMRGAITVINISQKEEE
ncbi:hypothetical protein [Thermonema rossianum]|uniref:hypothetical protein n=1 Tax=Thermonema rossianum TaxID=55505 RepID=UPI00056F710B|nr:hypothetical protein [Thermonema rossianum]